MARAGTRGGPSISKSAVDRAGNRVRRFVVGQLGDDADVVVDDAGAIDTWRATHSYPLSLVTPGVRNWVSQETGGEVVVAQRLKRFDRIVDKLARFPSMRLVQMEDIAGCRAVLLSPAEVEAVARRIRRKWDVRGESDYRESKSSFALRVGTTGLRRRSARRAASGATSRMARDRPSYSGSSQSPRISRGRTRMGSHATRGYSTSWWISDRKCASASIKHAVPVPSRVV